MALLANHLEQINLSAQSIGELDFSRSKPFTNALLHNQEITALIRDTEPHERGLFSVDSSIRHSNGQARAGPYGNDNGARRRTTQLASQHQQSAVARVLGTDMLRKIQSSNRDSSRGRNVDIEVLLQGAGKLCATYDVPGTKERIIAVRNKHQQVTDSITFYEGKLKKQQSSSSRHQSVHEDAQFESLKVPPNTGPQTGRTVTDEDLTFEEDIVRELEDRKRALEARVLGMEKDLDRLRE